MNLFFLKIFAYIPCVRHMSYFFSCNKQPSVSTAGTPLNDGLSDKLNSIFSIVASAELVCVITLEGILKSSKTRSSDSEVVIHSSDTIYTIASLKSALDRFLKIFQLSGCPIIHISGDYYIFSFYIINTQYLLAFSHQLDSSCGIVADFKALDDSMVPFLDDLRNSIALST